MALGSEWEKKHGFYKHREDGKGKNKELMHWTIEKIKPVAVPIDGDLVDVYRSEDEEDWSDEEEEKGKSKL